MFQEQHMQLDIYYKFSVTSFLINWSSSHLHQIEVCSSKINRFKIIVFSVFDQFYYLCMLNWPFYFGV